MADQLEENKRNVVAFYALMFNQGKPAEAVEKYVGDAYVQHNPGAADGKQAFIEQFTRMAAQYPGKCAQFKRVIAEGDLVVLHCFQHWPGDRDLAGIEIFRVDERCRIVEHWDELQTIPLGSTSSKTMS